MMNEDDIGQLCKGTPTISVLDNCGLSVREIQFNRAKIGDELDTRITRHTYNAAGHLHTSIDPRFFNLLQEQGDTAPVQANLTYKTGLAGQPLGVDSIDAGSRITLTDITGAPHLEWDGKTLRRFEYDEVLHRPTAITEQVNGETAKITERFVYNDSIDDDTAGKNLIGQLVRHYDNAGLQEINSTSLTGQPLSETRQLLPSETADSDWQGDNDAAWQILLASDDGYTTAWTYNALGMLLTQQDAKGNVQRSEYDITGSLTASYLKQNGKNEQCIVSGFEYNARGQKVREVAGNGVVTEYSYDEKTSRLNEVKTTRENDASPLQDLRYSYDPVGNILAIADQASATRFYKNQKVSATNAYEYDALYQLTKASGRENATDNAQSSSLPTPNIPLPSDSHQLRNYSRTYGYDRGGNLEQVQHIPSSAKGYTTKMVVSERSNRAIKQNIQPTITRGDVDGYFDVHGNLKQLEGSKNLVWGRRDQLKQVVITGQQQEHYQYTVQGQRIRKTLKLDDKKQEQVIYLPGLELRRKYNTAKSVDTVTEDLHVLTLGQAGRAQVRLQHWEAGKPANEKDIPNNQLRYSLDNHLGSSNLELNQDAEIISQEEYYPFGGTAVWSAKSDAEAKYKTVRYSGQERDATGLYYYGYRYYASWMGRWLNPDPAWTIDGLNLYRMVRNNPVTLRDVDGRASVNGVMYASFASEDIISQAMGRNLSRDKKGKKLYPLIAANNKDKSEIEASRQQKISYFTKKGNQFPQEVQDMQAASKMSVDQIRKAMGAADYDKAILDGKNFLRQADIFKRMEILSNEGGKELTKLKNKKHKLYIIGHGGPGLNMLAADEDCKIGMMDASGLAEQLSNGGLDKKFSDIRAVSCYSADTRDPKSFKSKDLAAAAKPDYDSKSPSTVTAEPFAQSLSNALSKVGFANPNVAGYHGGGVTMSSEHHYRRLPGSQQQDIRSSKARERFPARK